VLGEAWVDAGWEEREYDMEGTPAENEDDVFGGGSVRSECGGGGGIPLEFRISSTLLW